MAGRHRNLIHVNGMAKALDYLSQIQKAVTVDDSVFAAQCHDDARKIIALLRPDVVIDSPEHAEKVIAVALVMRGEGS